MVRKHYSLLYTQSGNYVIINECNVTLASDRDIVGLVSKVKEKQSNGDIKDGPILIDEPERGSPNEIYCLNTAERELFRRLYSSRSH